MGRQWLVAETILGKAGKPALTLADVETIGLPESLQEWASAQISKVPFDYDSVGQGFGAEMSKWWTGLRLKSNRGSKAILAHNWCRNGHTGIVMLILGMHWWAQKSGAGTQWKKVMREMTDMFNAVASAPSL